MTGLEVRDPAVFPFHKCTRLSNLDHRRLTGYIIASDRIVEAERGDARAAMDQVSGVSVIGSRGIFFSMSSLTI